jgi:hypothetical protein
VVTQLPLFRRHYIIIKFVQIRKDFDYDQPIVVNLCRKHMYLRAWVVLQPQHLQILEFGEVLNLLYVLDQIFAQIQFL